MFSDLLRVPHDGGESPCQRTHAYVGPYVQRKLFPESIGNRNVFLERNVKPAGRAETEFQSEN